jgi:hypothetical protein
MSASKPFKRTCKLGTGKRCEQCGTTVTPNWRRGWGLPDGGFANLCNACGIRYKPGKGRRRSDSPLGESVPPPKQGPTKGRWATPVGAAGLMVGGDAGTATVARKPIFSSVATAVSLPQLLPRDREAEAAAPAEMAAQPW